MNRVRNIEIVIRLGQVSNPLDQSNNVHGDRGDYGYHDARPRNHADQGKHEHDRACRRKSENELVDAQSPEHDSTDPGRNFLVDESLVSMGSNGVVLRSNWLIVFVRSGNLELAPTSRAANYKPDLRWMDRNVRAAKRTGHCQL